MQLGTPQFGMAANNGLQSRPVPRSFRKPLADVDPYLAIDSARWLRTHGRPPPPKLSDTQRKELDQCFKLIDTDRGGTVDAAELGNALQVGMRRSADHRGRKHLQIHL
jgi:EF-hand domain